VRHIVLLAAAVAAALAVAGGAGSAPAAAPPTRIVSLSPTATEDLFAIGAGPQVVAVDDQSDYPTSAPRTKLSGFKPNVEAIARYRPDLVVASYDANELVAGLRKLHVPVLLQPGAATLDDAYAQMEELGRATGHAAQARSLVARIKGRIAAIVAALPHHDRTLTVYHELSPDFYSATSKTFIGRVYTLLGLRDVADPAARGGNQYPQLSGEYIVSQAPDLIVLADSRCCGATPTTVAARPGWSSIPAVRDRRIVVVDDSIASRWGPRIVNFVRAVASALATIKQ
jgi:iron complex transport system substrate-binding protein